MGPWLLRSRDSDTRMSNPVSLPISTTRVKISSFAELDAMVGAHLTSEVPKTHWEDVHAHLRCATFEEALEVMRDPYLPGSALHERNPDMVLREVHVYREYSTNLEIAWEIVEKLTAAQVALSVRQDAGRWIASFGTSPAASAVTAPLAICLAGLRMCGIEVELQIAM